MCTGKHRRTADGKAWQQDSVQVLVETPPGPGERTRLELDDEDGRGRHGLQWFFGIHGYRGQYEHLGRLWLE